MLSRWNFARSPNVTRGAGAYTTRSGTTAVAGGGAESVGRAFSPRVVWWHAATCRACAGNHPPLGHLAVAYSRLCVGAGLSPDRQAGERGNNLLIDEIHDPKKTVPLRRVPLVLAGTVIFHFWNFRAVSSNRFCHFTTPLQAPLSCINQRFQGASGFLTKSTDGTLTLPLGGDFRLPAPDRSGLKTAFLAR